MRARTHTVINMNSLTSISRATLAANLRDFCAKTNDELADIQALAIIAWSKDMKAGNVESAAYNDLIATQCAHALKLKAMTE